MPGPPVPPSKLPPARTLIAPGRGELFLRDTGGEGLVVMLLHGWIATADLNWRTVYDDLHSAGYRVLAIDHRGHGRGMRPLEPFRLADCAADAAAALRELDVAPSLVVGYSMGGAIAQLLARDHLDVISGLVLSGTAQHFQGPRMRRDAGALRTLGVSLSLSPVRTWRWGLRRAGLPETDATNWLVSELTRHSVRDIVEGGRELGRFDSRPWLRPLGIPSAVVVTTKDEIVPPSRQRELAAALDAQVFEAQISHLEVASRPDRYNRPLLDALAAVSIRERAAT